MDWTFPAAIEEESSLAAPRPRLHHATTAPVGELHHQSIAVLDLDDLYNPADFAPPPTRLYPNFDDEGQMTQTTAEENLRNKFRDETTTPTAYTLHHSPPREEIAFRSKERVETNQPATAEVSQSHAATSSDEESTDADGINLYDPFFFRPYKGPASTKDIEDYIASTGVTDSLEVAVLRRDIVQGRNGGDEIMKKILYQNGYQNFLDKDINQAPGMYDLPRGYVFPFTYHNINQL